MKNLVYNGKTIEFFHDDDEFLFWVLVDGQYDEMLQTALNKEMHSNLLNALEDYDEDNADAMQLDDLIEYYFTNN